MSALIWLDLDVHHRINGTSCVHIFKSAKKISIIRFSHFTINRSAATEVAADVYCPKMT